MPRKKNNQITSAKVFVAGGLPSYTYNPRASLNLERKLKDYLDEGNRVLSIHGPTKTGKTVLVRSVVPRDESIWISGGSIGSIDEFWTTIAEDLELDTEIENSDTYGDAETRTWIAQGNVGVVGGSYRNSDSTNSNTGTKRSRTRTAKSAARSALNSDPTPIIIDDFHYINPEVQVQIIRGIKDLVFDGLPVILIAVPHRAYDAVRVEREMTGRVQPLEVGFWSNQELLEIAIKGFQALNVDDPENYIANKLMQESFQSPYLMQDFCLQVCKVNGITTRQDKKTSLHEPNWSDLFSERAQMASKSTFDLLSRGPRQRTDRKPRRMKNGETLDIYGAVLSAIAETGPLTELNYESLRASLKEVMEEPPQRHEVTRVLDEMSKIAREKVEGEPVVDYDEELRKLHISDPYFAFFLRWGRKKESN